MKYLDTITAIALALSCSMLGCAYIFSLTAGVAPVRAVAAVKGVFPPALSTSDVSVEAKAAILYDPTTGRVLYQKNANESLSLASLTKLMTADTVLSATSSPAYVTITSDDMKLAADAGDWGFRAGDVVSLSDLIKIGLVASSNAAMAAAAGSLGTNYLAQMNAAAGQLGLTHTYFNNATGLDLNAEMSGGYGSAYDVARLASYFYRQYPDYFDLTEKSVVSIQASGRTVSVAATALPLQTIPGFVAAKTGYTDLAGGNLVAVFDIEVGHPLIAVVLGSSEDGRFVDVKNLIAAERQAIE